MFCVAAHAQELQLVQGVEAQPLKAQVKRIVDALEFLGEPLNEQRQADLTSALKEMDSDKAVAAIQKVLDPLCLVGVNINPETPTRARR